MQNVSIIRSLAALAALAVVMATGAQAAIKNCTGAAIYSTCFNNNNVEGGLSWDVSSAQPYQASLPATGGFFVQNNKTHQRVEVGTSPSAGTIRSYSGSTSVYHHYAVSLNLSSLVNNENNMWLMVGQMKTSSGNSGTPSLIMGQRNAYTPTVCNTGNFTGPCSGVLSTFQILHVLLADSGGASPNGTVTILYETDWANMVNTWTSIEVQTTFSSDPAVGRIKLRVNGTDIYGPYYLKTYDSTWGNVAYKAGTYRGIYNTSDTIGPQTAQFKDFFYNACTTGCQYF